MYPWHRNENQLSVGQLATIKTETGYNESMLVLDYASSQTKKAAAFVWSGENGVTSSTNPAIITSNNINNNNNNSSNNNTTNPGGNGGTPDPGNSPNAIQINSPTAVQNQNPTQGLVHWMSAVMAEHMTSNSHHDPTVGMHYMWNGAVDQCGQHNKDIDYSGWPPTPRNHVMSISKQGYEAKMNEHQNGLQKGHILEDHHHIVQSQMAPGIYGATGVLRTNSSNSSSPGGHHGHGGTPAALLVVPQPINATKIINGTGTGRKYTSKGGQAKKKPAKRSAAQVYNHKTELQLQQQMHLRETKPYKCSQCTKAFANSSYLSQHTRIHLGIKPYRCEICQRKFTQLSHLQQHIRTHTGDKPYRCRHHGCQKAFSQLSNLQSHSRSHQTDKPYKCNSCYKCFLDEPSLLEHIPKHKESKHLKTHICQYCGKSYTQETYLSKHMQKHSERTDKRPPITALGLGVNRNLALGTPIPGGEHPYWPKVSPDSANSLTDVMQQQQQQQQQQQSQQHQTTHHDFASAIQQQQQQQQHTTNGHIDLQTHHRNIIESHRDDVGEDLVVNRQTQPQAITNNNNNNNQHLPSTSTPMTTTGSYDASITKTVSNSAFTPINAMTPHLNSLAGHHHQLAQRPYLYDAISFQNKNSVNQNTANSFPNQLISLHQIRNYAHQPGSLMAGEHLLGVSVGPGKDKG